MKSYDVLLRFRKRGKGEEWRRHLTVRAESESEAVNTALGLIPSTDAVHGVDVRETPPRPR